MQRCLYPFAYVYHNAMIAGTSSASLRCLRLISLDNDTSVNRSVKMSVKIFPFIKAELLLILFGSYAIAEKDLDAETRYVPEPTIASMRGRRKEKIAIVGAFRSRK